MKRKINLEIYPHPMIFNIYKPVDINSYDIVRHFKRHLPSGFGKIGHFGTLDPFACGVLMIGVNGAARLNNIIHDCLSKTYIADGILGIETPTGDMTEEASQVDNSEYLNEVISTFDAPFIEKKLQENFLGDYLQAPHSYSASKHEGKALHKWAREGVIIQKEKKKRFIHSIKVLEYQFPKLKIKFEVSSGTFIRTLFSECAQYLGTLGTLEGLERSAVGSVHKDSSITQNHWPKDKAWDLAKYMSPIDQVLPFNSLILDDKESKLFTNGVALKIDRALDNVGGSLDSNYVWARDKDSKILGLCDISSGLMKSYCNFSSNC